MKVAGMHYVYILGLASGQIYTGFTSDLKRRLDEHERGYVDSTRKWLPVELIHYEAYSKMSDAKRREIFLKKSEGKKLLKKQIRDILAEFKEISCEEDVTETAF